MIPLGFSSFKGHKKSRKTIAFFWIGGQQNGVFWLLIHREFLGSCFQKGNSRGSLAGDIEPSGTSGQLPQVPMPITVTELSNSLMAKSSADSVSLIMDQSLLMLLFCIKVI
jgi:hypothetical protein